MARVGGEEAVAQTAVDAFAGLTIVATQLNEGLAGERVLTLDAGFAKEGDNAVLFRAQVLKQGYGAVGHLVVIIHLATGIIEWGNSVDEHDIDAAFAQCTARTGRWLAKGVVSRPVAA